MMAEISGVKVVCRGVVHRLKEDKTALQAETETFRVLYAEEKSGIYGAFYVRAVLEKEEKDDGNGA